jgi:hypothetical protein
MRRIGHFAVLVAAIVAVAALGLAVAPVSAQQKPDVLKPCTLAPKTAPLCAAPPANQACPAGAATCQTEVISGGPGCPNKVSALPLRRRAGPGTMAPTAWLAPVIASPRMCAARG